MARIIFLGTSNANPHPNRRQTGIMLVIASNFYLFDCGDGIPSAIWNHEYITMNAIHCAFFSHYHADHAGGLMGLLLLMHQRIKNSRDLQPGRDGEGLSVFLPTRKGARMMEEMASLMHGDHFAYKKTFMAYPEEGMIYHDDLVSVKAFPTMHTAEARGFIIQAAGQTILYSGDTLAPTISAGAAMEEGADIVIHELAHFDNQSLAKAFECFDNGHLVLTHMQDDRIHDQEGVLRDMQVLKSRDTRVTLAHDGLEISLD